MKMNEGNCMNVFDLFSNSHWDLIIITHRAHLSSPLASDFVRVVSGCRLNCWLCPGHRLLCCWWLMLLHLLFAFVWFPYIIMFSICLLCFSSTDGKWDAVRDFRQVLLQHSDVFHSIKNRWPDTLCRRVVHSGRRWMWADSQTPYPIVRQMRFWWSSTSLKKQD